MTPGRTGALRLVAVLALALPLVPASAAPRPRQECARVTTPARALARPVDLHWACAEVEHALGRLSRRATVSVLAGDDGAAAEARGTDVLLDAPEWARLSPVGRRVVLAHELVHVATATTTSSTTPGWLVEGLAESVALEYAGLPDRVAAAELAAAVRAGQLPAHLPDDAAVAAAAPSTYQQAWLAVDLLRRRYGTGAVLRVYRARSWRAALERLTGAGVPAFERAWMVDLHRRLG